MFNIMVEIFFEQLYIVILIVHIDWTRPITDPSYEDVNNTFERALVFMHKVSLNPFFHHNDRYPIDTFGAWLCWYKF